MTEKEAKEFVGLNEKYNRSFFDTSNDFSYILKEQDGYISVERSDGRVINVAYYNLTKYPVKVHYDKNVTSILNVVGIDYAGEWHGWQMFVRCADVSPIRQRREMNATQRKHNYEKMMEEYCDKHEDLRNKADFAKKELPSAKATYDKMHTEFYTKFTAEERKRQFCHLKAWNDYIISLTNTIKEYNDICDKLWEIAGEGLEDY